MKTKVISDCEAIRARLTAYLLGEMRAEEEMVRSHLEACEVCRAEAHQLKQTLDAVRAALADPEIAPPVPARLSPDRRARLIAYAPRRPRRIPFRFWIALEAAAAILIVGLVSGVLILPRRSPSREELKEWQRHSTPKAAFSRERSPIQETVTAASAPSAPAKGPIYSGAPAATDAVPHDRVEEEYARKSEITAALPMEHEAPFLAHADPLEFDASKRPENGSASATVMRERVETAAAIQEEPMTDLILTAEGLSVSPTVAAPTVAPSAAREPPHADRRALRDMPSAPAVAPAGPLVDVHLVPSPFRPEIHWLHIGIQPRHVLPDDAAPPQAAPASEAVASLPAIEYTIEIRFNPRRVVWWRRIGSHFSTMVSESDGGEVVLTALADELRSPGILYELRLLTPEARRSASAEDPLATVEIRHGRNRDAVLLRRVVTDQHCLPSFAAAAAEIRLAIGAEELEELAARLQLGDTPAESEVRALVDELRRGAKERPSDAGLIELIRQIDNRLPPTSPAKGGDQ